MNEYWVKGSDDAPPQPPSYRPEKSHYQPNGPGGVEPIDLIISQGLDFLEGNVVKYVVRYKRKGGYADLMKAKQYLDWLLEREHSTGEG